MIFGPLIGIVSSRYGGFAAPFFVAAALQLLTLWLTVTLLPESRSQRPAERSAVGLTQIAATFADPRLARILWQKLALSLGLYAWFSVMSLFLIGRLHFGIDQTYLFFSLISIVSVVVNLFVIGKVSERLGDRGMSNAGLLSLVLAFLIVPAVHGLALLPVMAVLFSIGMGFANTGITALISNAGTADRQGTVLGVSSSLDSFSGIVSPVASTGLLARFGPSYAGAASAFFAACALVMGLAAGRNEARQRLAQAHSSLPATDPVQSSATTARVAAKAE